ncbi:hypothetical protein D3C83_124140 [compost metagenome]
MVETKRMTPSVSVVIGSALSPYPATVSPSSVEATAAVSASSALYFSGFSISEIWALCSNR